MRHAFLIKPWLGGEEVRKRETLKEEVEGRGCLAATVAHGAAAMRNRAVKTRGGLCVRKRSELVGQGQELATFVIKLCYH